MAKNADLLRFTNEWLYQIAEIVPNFFIDIHRLRFIPQEVILI